MTLSLRENLQGAGSRLDAGAVGRAAHRRRVGLLAREMAGRLGCKESQLMGLDEAAARHHCWLQSKDFETGSRLFRDLFPHHLETGAERPQKPRRSQEAEQILRSLQCPASNATPVEAALGQILNFACLVDGRNEFLPYESMSGGQFLREVYALVDEGIVQRPMADTLASFLTLRREFFGKAAATMPVFPAVAVQAIELMADGNAPLGEFERLISSDQVLAGELIRYANSAYCGGQSSISTISSALLHIGIDAARQLSTAAVFRPMFSRPGTHHLWLHSLEIAELCDRLAGATEDLNPAEAFLAGLVHDVGRLAIELAPEQATAFYHRLVAANCEVTVADQLLMGFDHGAAGAEVLRAWMFPPHLIDAIEYHHRPECATSALAQVIYLAEFWTDTEEDVPSRARLDNCLRQMGITSQQLATYARGKGLLTSMFSGG